MCVKRPAPHELVEAANEDLAEGEPEEALTCDRVEGCILAQNHDGDCVTVPF